MAVDRIPCQCDPPGSDEGCNGHCLDITGLWKLKGAALEEAYTVAAGWVTYYTEQLGWVESRLKVMSEGLRLKRLQTQRVIQERAAKRVYKEDLEAAAYDDSEKLRVGIKQQLELEAEAALLKRLVEYWDTAHRTISRQISLRDEEYRDDRH